MASPSSTTRTRRPAAPWEVYAARNWLDDSWCVMHVVQTDGYPGMIKVVELVGLHPTIPTLDELVGSWPDRCQRTGGHGVWVDGPLPPRHWVFLGTRVHSYGIEPGLAGGISSFEGIARQTSDQSSSDSGITAGRGGCFRVCQFELRSAQARLTNSKTATPGPGEVSEPTATPGRHHERMLSRVSLYNRIDDALGDDPRLALIAVRRLLKRGASVDRTTRGTPRS